MIQWGNSMAIAQQVWIDFILDATNFKSKSGIDQVLTSIAHKREKIRRLG